MQTTDWLNQQWCGFLSYLKDISYIQDISNIQNMNLKKKETKVPRWETMTQSIKLPEPECQAYLKGEGAIKKTWHNKNGAPFLFVGPWKFSL